MNNGQNDFTNMKIIIKNSANYVKKYSKKDNVFEIYDYQNYYSNDFQLTVKNYEKLLKKNSSTTCYICDTDFSSNNKLHQHFMNCAKIIQSKQSSLNTDNLQIIKFIVINKTISEDYVFRF